MNDFLTILPSNENEQNLEAEEFRRVARVQWYNMAPGKFYFLGDVMCP